MKKEIIKTKAGLPKKRTTWTIQPEDDVLKLVEKIIGEEPDRGMLTKLINAALRAKNVEAYNAVLDEEILRLEVKRKVLDKTILKRD